MNTGVGPLAQSSALGDLGVFVLGIFLSVSRFLVVGVSLKLRILKVFTRGFEVHVLGVLDLRNDLFDDLFFLLLASARLLGSLLLGVGLLRRLLSSCLLGRGLLRGSLLLNHLGVGVLLRRLLGSGLLGRGLLRGSLLLGDRRVGVLLDYLLRGSLLRRGLLRGRLLLGGGASRVRRGLLGARRLLRGGRHLRGFFSRRGVLCRSARCTHTGPFH